MSAGNAVDYAEALTAIQRAVTKLESVCCNAAVSRSSADLGQVRQLAQGIRAQCVELERWSTHALPVVGDGGFDWMHPPGVEG